MAAESSQASSGKTSKDVVVDELLRNMDLHEAELDDVVLGKEVVGSWPRVKWLAAAKVLTQKSFGLQTLKSTMLAATGIGENTKQLAGSGEECRQNQ